MYHWLISIFFSSMPFTQFLKTLSFHFLLILMLCWGQRDWGGWQGDTAQSIFHTNLLQFCFSFSLACDSAFLKFLLNLLQFWKSCRTIMTLLFEIFTVIFLFCCKTLCMEAGSWNLIWGFFDTMKRLYISTLDDLYFSLMLQHCFFSSSAPKLCFQTISGISWEVGPYFIFLKQNLCSLLTLQN